MSVLLYGSVVGPILGVTVCASLARKKSWSLLAVVGLLYGLGHYALNLHEYGPLDGGLRAAVVALLPAVGGWAYARWGDGAKDSR
jgi:hypothetical protein